MFKVVSNRKANNRSAAGFTLIELLLVLVILAALAAVVIPKFTGRSEQARITAASTDISNIELALTSFEVDNSRFPTSSEGLRALVEKPSNVTGWIQPYLNKGVPVDPWGNKYVYKYPGQHNKYGYDLYSFGPDGKEGGDDDIVNWTRDEDRR